MNFSKTLLLLLGAFCLSLTFTTLGFAHDEEAPDPSEWHGLAGVGYNFTDGNSETSLLNIQLKAEREKDSNIWRFEGNHRFGDQTITTAGVSTDTTNIDASSILAEYKRLLSERLYAGVGTEYRRDQIADVKYRVSINPAVGYFFFKDDDLRFNVEAGPSYIFEEVSGVSDDYFAPRVGQRLEYQISPTAKIFEEAFVTWDIDDSENYIVNGSAGLEASIYESLSLIVAVVDTYDNVPGAGLLRNDIALLTTLAYTY